jgi:hypothetical protein
MPEGPWHTSGAVLERINQTIVKARRLTLTYCLTMSWGMDELVDALAAGASDVVDITYSLSRREAKNAGHGSVGKETYISRNNRMAV